MTANDAVCEYLRGVKDKLEFDAYTLTVETLAAEYIWVGEGRLCIFSY